MRQRFEQGKVYDEAIREFDNLRKVLYTYELAEGSLGGVARCANGVCDHKVAPRAQQL